MIRAAAPMTAGFAFPHVTSAKSPIVFDEQVGTDLRARIRLGVRPSAREQRESEDLRRSPASFTKLRPTAGRSSRRATKRRCLAGILISFGTTPLLGVVRSLDSMSLESCWATGLRPHRMPGSTWQTARDHGAGGQTTLLPNEQTLFGRRGLDRSALGGQAWADLSLKNSFK